MNPLRRITLASTHVFHGATRSNESAVVHFSLRTEADPAPSGDTMWEHLAPLFPRSEKPVFDGQPVDAVAPLQLFCHLLRALHSEALTEKDSVQLRENSNGSALVIAACEDAQTTLYAGELAADLVSASAEGALDVQSWHQELAAFVEYAWHRSLDPNARLLMDAANGRGIPVIRLDRPPFTEAPADRVIQHGLFQLGWGVKQVRFLGPRQEYIPVDTLKTAYLRDRFIAAMMDAGLPVPAQDLEFPNKRIASRARRAAERIGFPVTVRSLRTPEFQYVIDAAPVFGPLNDANQVEIAFPRVARDGESVWVEAMPAGILHRVLIVAGEAAAVARCGPPSVTGNGASTLRDLIADSARRQSSPFARRAWSTLLRGDADLESRLAVSGLSLDMVVSEGHRIPLRGHASIHVGGWSEDVTGSVGAELKNMAARAAARCGLSDLAGVDLVVDDGGGAVILGVIPDPDLLMHQSPGTGRCLGVAQRVVDSLLPSPAASRIPIAAITGTNGKTTTSRMVAHILRQTGRNVGLACTDGIYLNGELVSQGDWAGYSGALGVLSNPRTEIAVLETARGGMATTGIAFDHCDVGACLNVARDHLGTEGIETLDEMALHKRQVIERSRAAAVLNAEDPRCLAMAEASPAEALVLVSGDPQNPVIKAHCRDGGTAIVRDRRDEKDWIVMVTGEEQQPLICAADIPATFGGRADHNVQNALFAIAIALGLGAAAETAASALRSFRMSVGDTPGRLNEISGFPFRVIVDAAHNAHGCAALVKFTDSLEVSGRRILLMGARGTLPDEDIIAMASAVAGHYDHYVAKNYHPDRMGNRDVEEAPRMMRDELVRRGVPGSCVTLSPDHLESVDVALDMAGPGDLVVIQVTGGQTDKWDILDRLKARGATIDTG